MPLWLALTLAGIAVAIGYLWGRSDERQQARLARWRDAKAQLERDGFVLSFTPATEQEYKAMVETSRQMRDRREVERLIRETR